MGRLRRPLSRRYVQTVQNLKFEVMKNRFKTIRKGTKTLLESGESSIVDYKTNEKFDSDDLVAFANSKDGGTLLLGVKEVKDRDGRMYGEPVGCSLTDKIFQTIENKATSCIPPIHIEVSEENTDKTPFLRIDIPSSKHKPHCTGAGTYKIRGQIKNTALVPSALLEMLINKESEKFYEQFSESTTGLIKKVKELESNLSISLDSLVEDLNNTQDRLQSGLDNLNGLAEESFGQAEEANIKSEESNDALQRVETTNDNIQKDIDTLTRKVDSILISEKISDRSNPFGLISMNIALSQSQKISDSDITEVVKCHYPTLTDDDISSLFKEANCLNSELDERKKARNK